MASNVSRPSLLHLCIDAPVKSLRLPRTWLMWFIALVKHRLLQGSAFQLVLESQRLLASVSYKGRKQYDSCLMANVHNAFTRMQNWLE